MSDNDNRPMVTLGPPEHDKPIKPLKLTGPSPRQVAQTVRPLFAEIEESSQPLDALKPRLTEVLWGLLKNACSCDQMGVVETMLIEAHPYPRADELTRIVLSEIL